eukprot:SAG25_NODE_3104_length_1217_cov_0.895349_2_plen_77_part_00
MRRVNVTAFGRTRGETKELTEKAKEGVKEEEAAKEGVATKQEMEQQLVGLLKKLGRETSAKLTAETLGGMTAAVSV